MKPTVEHRLVALYGLHNPNQALGGEKPIMLPEDVDDVNRRLAALEAEGYYFWETIENPPGLLLRRDNKGEQQEGQQ